MPGGPPCASASGECGRGRQHACARSDAASWAGLSRIHVHSRAHSTCTALTALVLRRPRRSQGPAESATTAGTEGHGGRRAATHRAAQRFRLLIRSLCRRACDLNVRKCAAGNPWETAAGTPLHDLDESTPNPRWNTRGSKQVITHCSEPRTTVPPPLAWGQQERGSRKAARLPEPARRGRARSSRARPRVATLPAREPSCVCDFPDGSLRRMSRAMAAEATRGRCCARADLGAPRSRPRRSAQLLRMRRAAEHRR